MALTTYQKSVAAPATLTGVLDADRFELEVRASAITVAYAGASSVDGADLYEFAFKAPLTSQEEILLDQLLSAHSGLPLDEPKNQSGIPLTALHGKDNMVQIAPREGKELRRCSHDFCDPLTWYMTSQRLTSGTTTSDPANKIWETSSARIIDLEHGRVHDELNVVLRDLSSGGGHGYLPRVTVGGTVQKRLPPHLENDLDPTAQDWTGAAATYDYRVDYANGNVVFKAAPAQAPIVEHSTPVDSRWYLTPDELRRVDIDDVELQWMGDITYNADIVMELEYEAAPGTWVVVPNTTKMYRGFKQIADDARGAYPEQPPMGGSPVWRGTNNASLRHSPLGYGTLLQIAYSQNLRVSLHLAYLWFDESNTLQRQTVGVAQGGLGGERATAMFYSTSAEE